MALAMDYNNKAIAKMLTIIEEKSKDTIKSIVRDSISLSKDEWDSL